MPRRGPDLDSTSRPASVPRRRSRRRSGLTAWSFRDVEVVSDGGAPAVELHGAVAQHAASLGVTVRVSLTHTRNDAGAVAMTERLLAPGREP